MERWLRNPLGAVSARTRGSGSGESNKMAATPAQGGRRKEKGPAAPQREGSMRAQGSPPQDTLQKQKEMERGGEAVEGKGPGTLYAELTGELKSYLAEELGRTIRETIQSSLASLQATTQQHEDRITEAEQRISDTDDRVVALEQKLEKMNKEAAWLHNKMDDLENRSRRNNLRIVGLPETVPNKYLDEICECELPQALGLNRPCRVERAHRVGPPQQARGGNRDQGENPQNKPKPRQVIMRYLDYKDKERLLQAFKRRRQPLLLQGSKVLIFGDYSPEVVRRRKQFNEVCTLLYKRNTPFQLLYPATLKVGDRSGQTRFFTNAEEALSKLTVREDEERPHRPRHDPHKSPNIADRGDGHPNHERRGTEGAHGRSPRQQSTQEQDPLELQDGR